MGAGVYIATTSNDSDHVAVPATTASTSSSTSSVQAKPTEITLPDTGSNSILDYSPAKLAASTAKYNLIFFHASWCTVCNSVQRSIEAGSIPDDLSIFKIDYDSNEGQALANKYHLPIQYTMVQVDNQGNEISQWINNFNDGVTEILDHLSQT